MRRNVRFEISYDGTRYLGWESQKNTDNTIQGKIEAVLKRMTDSEIKLIAAGRTDAGVHAKAMTANCILESDMNEADIKEYMNHYLPEDISIDKASFVDERFHSRYNAIGKTYRYTCYYGENKPIFDRKYVYRLEAMPDLNEMRKAAKMLEGEHDFASFCSNAKTKKSTVRIVDSINIDTDESYIYFTYHGNGFLYNMVRILTGTLLEVGYGKRKAESMPELLKGEARANAGATAPAQGLCLLGVDYL